MTVISWEDFTKGSIKDQGPFSMTIGVFDGIHKGHQYIFNKIISYKSTKTIVITFKDNPRYFFKDKTYPGNIFSISQKLDTLSSIGIDIVILIDFSYNFSKLTGKEFLHIIAENSEISHLSLGNNFRCGNNGMTTSFEALEILKSKNVLVDVEDMTYLENQLVSSTLIRDAILEGNLNKAQYMLERVYSLDIADIPQIIRDETIIIETKNIKQVLPPQGHYVVRIGSSFEMQVSNIYLNASEIVIPLQKMQKLDFIKFIHEEGR
ncbi:MAG: FAD synthetase family protein [Spirochaetia bacterium]|jgi:riboflavin kinase/FMN adenylyltransferase|nr:FAD synthetase family protein [Spirochaetia bacterium]